MQHNYIDYESSDIYMRQAEWDAQAAIEQAQTFLRFARHEYNQLTSTQSTKIVKNTQRPRVRKFQQHEYKP